MARIVMLLTNPYRPDTRVQREAISLTNAGHSITVVGWDRQAEFPFQETHEGVKVVRIQSVRSAYGVGWRQLFSLPRFWKAALRTAIELEPEVIHCHDLDTLYAGREVKKHIGCRLVFDAHEDYPSLMSLYLPSPLIWLLRRLERHWLHDVDTTLTASSVLADRLVRQGIQPITPIGNYPTLEAFDKLTEVQVQAARQKIGLAPTDYVVAYIGGFTRNRELLPLVAAGRCLSNVHVIFWGDGKQRQAIEAAIIGAANLRYLGWLPADLVPLYTRLADVIYYCLRADYPGAIYNAPNTLGNAMAAGRPVIANPVGDLGRIVQETGCGILLPVVNSDTVRQAIETLRDPAQRAQMGSAGRLAAEQKYNWHAAETRLIQVYSQLLQSLLPPSL